ncbi:MULTISPECIES: NAD(P)/FAD-dependent oxidoreductase [Streptomycetaceae]|uniref:Monooxygenase n=1 Tax=Streptantibioticus cattleyicolor (strain ATCC 35852 / DSM 46488 / JCM 4925 / NBRC 14057 / NRRL 8057) TaxID=1003195 RepID=F8JZM4_STREN|nr:MULTISPECIES: FAD-dependent oxidoreductase [Streptomycetaceae]AEW97325.1 monooxygenase [Streptantibioticus cattleyicolor NRRL 8057 = DSM 46488]MYS61776.1 hydroxylase [Streptomyces sp. SID5468]CCB77647.1 putative monooxygenase [Streptantibioticus cattleyicolor NRRL 8057 = DSM 46488]
MPKDAVVIGGGLAGMLTARALLGHADRITVLERDRYPAGPVFRKGVPQARHLHIFLSGGHDALETLLPGTGAALREAGAHRLDIPRDLLTRMPSGWQRRIDDPSTFMLSCTRPLLDAVVRDRVLAEAGDRIQMLQDTTVTGLLGTAHRVTGVTVRTKDADATERELPATLVADAAGRTSRAAQWLAALGLPEPRLEVVDSGLAYATRALRLPQPPDAALYIQPAPGNPRGGVLVPVEDGIWLMTLYGVRGHHPPTDPEGFLAFSATLAHGRVHDLAKGAEPAGPVHGFRDTANRRRHYDAPGAVPEGFIAVADAACTFNPVYGQGMSVACQGALALRAVLDGTPLDRPGFAATAQRAVSATARSAWAISSGADRPYVPGATDALGLADRVLGRYFARVTARAAMDPVVRAAYHHVLCLTAPPTRLLAPPVALRALFTPARRGLPDPPSVVERR